MQKKKKKKNCMANMNASITLLWAMTITHGLLHKNLYVI